jgi:hypothetical protein
MTVAVAGDNYIVLGVVFSVSELGGLSSIQKVKLILLWLNLLP